MSELYKGATPPTTHRAAADAAHRGGPSALMLVCGRRSDLLLIGSSTSQGCCSRARAYGRP